MKQRTKKRCFMIIALSLAALFLVNNAGLVYAYANDSKLSDDIVVTAVVTDEEGNSYTVDAKVIETKVTRVHNTRTSGGDTQDFVAEATMLLPRPPANADSRAGGSITQNEDHDSTIVATATIYFTLKSYADGATGILLTSFSSNYTRVDNSSIVNKLVSVYGCKGHLHDQGDVIDASQGGTITRYGNFTYNTGFTKYVLIGGLTFFVGANVTYHCEDRLGSWTTTLYCQYISN